MFLKKVGTVLIIILAFACIASAEAEDIAGAEAIDETAEADLYLINPEGVVVAQGKGKEPKLIKKAIYRPGYKLFISPHETEKTVDLVVVQRVNFEP
jgi:hypothetical protein